MELVDAGQGTRKWLRFYQTIRNLPSGDLGIPLVVIQLGVTELKKTRSCIPRLACENGKEGAVLFSA